MGKKGNREGTGPGTGTGTRPSNTVQRPSTPPALPSESSYAPNASYDSSPPRTPPSQIGRAGKSKGVGGIRAPRNRPALRDTFGDQVRDGEIDHSRTRSNSHELFWSPNRNPRASVVDNMLASFDQLSTNNSSQQAATTTTTTTTHTSTRTTSTTSKPSSFSFYTDPFATEQRIASARAGRARGHTVSSSTSSGYSFHAESPASRGHRSNSSSNFQSSLGRIDSVRVVDQGEDKSEPSKSTGTTAKTMPTGHRARKGSKSSGTSSVDLGSVAGNLRWQRGQDRRSSSFDFGSSRPAFPSSDLTSTSSPRNTGSQHQAMMYSEIETAPTPTVHAGPRRNDSRDGSPAPATGYRPGSQLSNTLPAPTRRRGSIRSPMAIFQRPEKSDGEEQGDLEKQQPARLQKPRDSFSNTQAMRTPEKGFTNSSLNQSISAPNPVNANKEKEKDKPGFFKRVFGSSKTSQPPSSQESTPTHSKTASTQLDKLTPKSTENAPPVSQARGVKSSQVATQQRPPTGEKCQPKEQPSQSLNKKSSFFRRRKKSVSDSSNVPVPPLQLQSQWHNPSEKSPTSSLRHAMDPFLAGSQGMRPPSSDSNRAVNSRDGHRRDESFGRSTIRAVHRSKDSGTTIPAPGLSMSKAGGMGERRFPIVQDRQRQGAAQENKIATEKPAKNKQARTKERTDMSAANKTAENFVKLESPPRPWMKPDASSDEELSIRKGESRQDRSRGLDQKASASTIASDFQSTDSKQDSFSKKPSREATGSEPVVSEDSAYSNRPSGNHIIPTDDDRNQAEKLFTGESNVPMAEVAAWLGDAGPERARIRKAYMGIFDWQNMSILGALRSFCNQLRLKGESQQVDRLLDSLAYRWCECNPNHGFKATDVVHTICYSLILLNTDLHLADIEQRMTRGQFIKNTIPTIRKVIADAVPDAFPTGPTARASMLPPPKPIQDEASSAPDSPGLHPPSRPKLNTRPSDHSGNEQVVEAESLSEDCGPLVKAPFTGRQYAWETQIETVLKNFYNSIRQERLPLVKAGDRKTLEQQPSSTSLSATSGNVLRRTGSMLSKAGSESLPARGRFSENRTGSRWSSKNRSRPRIYQASLGRASQTSINDDNMSAISPSASSMWSKYSLGKTQTSMSVNSYSSDYPPRGDYQRSIGFANALSQAIIREDAASDAHEEIMRVVPLLEDESLELAGAPWAKEGLLKHKHHLESVDKKAKDRNWNECFAVVDKGWMRMFQFNASARSIRQKARNQKLAGGVVGGGNWTENAEPLGKFSLRQTIASALPPPGYSRARPHVFALSLPNGAVHLFQVGTPEIVKEFVSSANYWSARMSKEPLVGGVSNIEYGWSDAVINLALLDNSRPSSSLAGPRPSIQSSIRGSIDQATSKPRLPGDRITISDWTPPTVSMMESQLLEVDQLRALTNYVKSIEEELSRHQELRPAISLAFSPRHPNAQKAMNNWERKSSYLLREIVKFRTYIDSLQQAQVMKDKVYKEREEYELEKQKIRDADMEDSNNNNNNNNSGGKEIEA